jgi:hypothetical protein
MLLCRHFSRVWQGVNALDYRGLPAILPLAGIERQKSAAAAVDLTPPNAGSLDTVALLAEAKSDCAPPSPGP